MTITNKMIKKMAIAGGVVALTLVGFSALAVTNPQVQTNSATNIQNNSATLQGNLYDLGGDSSVTVWFQWGPSTSYGYETSHMSQSYTGNFNQTIYNLAPNTLFHFRAVAQNSYGVSYGQDMVFTSSQSGNYQTPVADAGPDQYVASGQAVTLQGSGYNPGGGNVTFSWSCNGGTLSSYSIAQPLYTAPNISTNNQANYTCTLTVYNNSGYSSSDSAIVYVNYGGDYNNNLSVQTNAATNNYNNQATLNGYLYNNYSSSYYANTYVWFEWGTTTSYGYQSNQQARSYSGAFSQNIANLLSNTTYHFRAVARGSNGQTVYGQDMTFYSGSGSGYGTGSLIVTKTARNLSAGTVQTYQSVTASPSDILQFTVTVQAATNQDVHNVVVRDNLPAGLTFYSNLVINGSSNYYGNNITTGITFNTIAAGQTVTVYYQAQVAPATYFSYGSSTMLNNVLVTSSDGGSGSASVSVFVNRQGLLGATSVSTGLTNNLFTDSFFIALLIIIALVWALNSKILGIKEKLVNLWEEYRV